jgi:hypothetical protein
MSELQHRVSGLVTTRRDRLSVIADQAVQRSLRKYMGHP